MVYTVKSAEGDQTFEGFRLATDPLPTTMTLEHVILAFSEGELLDAWYIDSANPLALDELRRFYRQTFGYEGNQVFLQRWAQPDYSIGLHI